MPNTATTTLYFNNRKRCAHECRCGTVHICGAYDHCAIIEPYVCQACELDALDQFFSTHPQEAPHEKH